MKIYDVIVEPITTEKSTMLSDKGKYVFRINRGATKVDVKKAIKHLYDADVAKVAITPIRSKTRLVGKGQEIVKRRQSKKATITIRDGKNIDITKFKEPKKKK